MYKLTNRSSRDDFNKIYNFILSLVIKNEEEAEAYETLESSRNALDAISVVLNINNEYTTEDQDHLKSTYVELNEYYVELYAKYNIHPIRARMAKDYDILHYKEGILTDAEIGIFNQYYYENVRYFNTVLYTRSLADEELYNNFCRFFVVFMTMERYLSFRSDTTNDVNLFDTYSIRNMFISYGLEEFNNLPLNYQQRILKNLNTLLKHKGTDLVIIDILSLFGFEDIKTFKYILAKNYERLPDGDVNWSKPYLEFIKIPQSNETYDKSFAEYDRVDYSTITATDIYWQATEEQLLKENFTYLNTKYIGIESAMDFLKQTLNMSYFLSLVYDIRINYPEFSNLLVESKTISQYNKIPLYDLIIGILALTIKHQGFKDKITTSVTSIRKVYGFNFTEIMEVLSPLVMDRYKHPLPVEYDGKIYNFHDGSYVWFPEVNKSTGTIRINMAQEGHTPKPKDIINLPYSLSKPLQYDNIANDATTISGKIDQVEFLKCLESNIEFRNSIISYIHSTNNYKAYRELHRLYDVLFSTKVNTTLFEGYDTYTDWIKDNNKDLYDFITPPEDITKDEEKEAYYRERVIDLANIVDNYLASNNNLGSLFLDNSTIIGGYFKDFLFTLINVFKSYTVDIQDMLLYYVFDDKLFGSLRLFDSQLFMINMKQYDMVDGRRTNIFHYAKEILRLTNSMDYKDLFDKLKDDPTIISIIDTLDKESLKLTMTDNDEYHSMSYGGDNGEILYEVKDNLEKLKDTIAINLANLNLKEDMILYLRDMMSLSIVLKHRDNLQLTDILADLPIVRKADSFFLKDNNLLIKNSGIRSYTDRLELKDRFKIQVIV